MIRLIKEGVCLLNGIELISKSDIKGIETFSKKLSINDIEIYKRNTIAYDILLNHNISNNMNNLKIKFDALASHDITYTSIIQTARASGMKEFPIPYILTNCHNSLCAVGGTINEDDHLFGLSAAKKYGGIYVPAHQAVIHQFMRELYSKCGSMILGSDSHTRYGALGSMAIGEGGPELVKQLLSKTYEIKYPEIIAVYLENEPQKFVGPQDVALSIIGQVFKNGFAKNKVLEFVGPGIRNLSVDFRNGIDVMTTETTCLSSIWMTDDKVGQFYKTHNRLDAYKELKPGEIAYYDGAIRVDLSKIEPMIALPFHPSNVYTVEELKNNTRDILALVEKESSQLFGSTGNSINFDKNIVDGKIVANQGIVAGCAGGTFENIEYVGNILNNNSIGFDEFTMSVYPSSQPIYYELGRNGTLNKIVNSGVIVKTAFCGPCFGAGDVPSNNGFSIRHTTRNFPNREGSKPNEGQISSVALMDAKSIAATAINKGFLTGANEIDFEYSINNYSYNEKIYNNRIYYGFNKPEVEHELKFGPNIKSWPEMHELKKNLLLKVASVINDPVTTTDELIPSGETSSYRSNPVKLAEFTLGRKDPNYYDRTKKIMNLELDIIKNGGNIDNLSSDSKEIIEKINGLIGDTISLNSICVGSVIYANKPGDGSAREQAASCQKVLGAWANIAKEYATKRYRSNCINWGIIPFITKDNLELKPDDYIFLPNIKKILENKNEKIEGHIFNDCGFRKVDFYLPGLTNEERDILLSGCLINYYKKTI